MQRSLLTRQDRNVSVLPTDNTIHMVVADVEAFWQFSKAWLVGYPLLTGARQWLGRKNSDELHVLVTVVEFVNVMEEKDSAHGGIILTGKAVDKNTGLAVRSTKSRRCGSSHPHLLGFDDGQRES